MQAAKLAAKRAATAAVKAEDEGEESSSEDEEEDPEKLISEKTQAQVQQLLQAAFPGCWVFACGGGARGLVSGRRRRRGKQGQSCVRPGGWQSERRVELACQRIPFTACSMVWQVLHCWPRCAACSRCCPQIFETLLKIRRRDQSIYQPDAKFYSSEEEEEEEGEDGAAAGAAAASLCVAWGGRRRLGLAGAGLREGVARRAWLPNRAPQTEPAAAASASARALAGEKKGKKERPMYLKDVLYKQAVEGGPDDSSGAALHWCYALALRCLPRLDRCLLAVVSAAASAVHLGVQHLGPIMHAACCAPALPHACPIRPSRCSHLQRTRALRQPPSSSSRAARTPRSRRS